MASQGRIARADPDCRWLQSAGVDEIDGIVVGVAVQVVIAAGLSQRVFREEPPLN